MSTSNERLFIDWTHVQKGILEMTLDPERITPEGRETIERNIKLYNILLEECGHGLKPRKMPFGVRLALEPARKSEPWLTADRPWEEAVSGYLSVIHEEGRYRCWYRVGLTSEAAQQICPDPRRTSVLAYAESADGVRWTKPDLDVFPFDGKPTNVVGFCTETAVMRDPSAPPAERYKAFRWSKLPPVEGASEFASHGLYGCVSPDGYRWTQLPEPLFRFFHDTQNVPAWDPVLGKYVAYLRDHAGGRAIGRSETDDFRNWPRHQTVLSPGPEDAPTEDYYTNCFTTYPGNPAVRLMFPAIFRHLDDNMYIRLAVSRDNLRWHWLSRDAILGPGNPPDWDCGTLYTGPNLVRLPDGRLALPYGGSRGTHTNYGAFYGGDPNEAYQVAWATWEDGRLAGIEADEAGEFFTGGETGDGHPIEINARTTAGGCIEAALHEPCGWGSKPIPGFGFENSVPFSGNALWTPLRWNGSATLAALKGKTFFIQFRLRRAKLFAYRVGGDADGGQAKVETMM